MRMVVVMVRALGRRRRWRRRWRHFRFVNVQLGQQRRVELVQVLGHRVRVHFDVREPLGVSLEMDLEVAFGGEPVAANVALERPFAGVRSNVDLQGRIAAEHLAAVPATVLEQLIFLAAGTAVGAATSVRASGTARMSAGPVAAHSVAEAQLVGQVGGQQSLRRVVQHILGRPLEQIQRTGPFRIRRRIGCLQDGVGQRTAGQLRHETGRRESVVRIGRTGPRRGAGRRRGSGRRDGGGGRRNGLDHRHTFDLDTGR